MNKNVLIPLTLLERIVELLNYWDTSNYDRAVRDDYDNVIMDINVKMQKLQLREAYSNIINANNEDARHDARIEYLWQKRQISNAIRRDFDA